MPKAIRMSLKVSYFFSGIFFFQKQSHESLPAFCIDYHLQLWEKLRKHKAVSLAEHTSYHRHNPFFRTFFCIQYHRKSQHLQDPLSALLCSETVQILIPVQVVSGFRMPLLKNHLSVLLFYQAVCADPRNAFFQLAYRFPQIRLFRLPVHCNNICNKHLEYHIAFEKQNL